MTRSNETERAPSPAFLEGQNKLGLYKVGTLFSFMMAITPIRSVLKAKEIFQFPVSCWDDQTSCRTCEAMAYYSKQSGRTLQKLSPSQVPLAQAIM